MDLLARFGIVVDILAWIIAIPLAAAAAVGWFNGADGGLQFLLGGMALTALLMGRAVRFILSGD